MFRNIVFNIRNINFFTTDSVFRILISWRWCFMTLCMSFADIIKHKHYELDLAWRRISNSKCSTLGLVEMTHWMMKFFGTSRKTLSLSWCLACNPFVIRVLHHQKWLKGVRWGLLYSETDFENVYKEEDQNKMVKVTTKMNVKRSKIETEAALSRGGVEGTRLRPRPRTRKKPEAKAKDSLFEDRHSRGQGQECFRPRPRTKDTSASALQKKKGLHKNFSSDLHKKTFSKKFFKRYTKF